MQVSIFRTLWEQVGWEENLHIPLSLATVPVEKPSYTNKRTTWYNVSKTVPLLAADGGVM